MSRRILQLTRILYGLLCGGGAAAAAVVVIMACAKQPLSPLLRIIVTIVVSIGVVGFVIVCLLLARANAYLKQIHRAIAYELKSRGWRVAWGAGERQKEWLPVAGGYRKKKARYYVDITAIKKKRVLRIQTIATRADGRTPVSAALTMAREIREKRPMDHLLLVSTE